MIFPQACENCKIRLSYENIPRYYRKIWNSYPIRYADSTTLLWKILRLDLSAANKEDDLWILCLCQNHNEFRVPLWWMRDYMIEMKLHRTITITIALNSLQTSIHLVRNSLIMQMKPRILKLSCEIAIWYINTMIAVIL